MIPDGEVPQNKFQKADLSHSELKHAKSPELLCQEDAELQFQPKKESSRLIYEERIDENPTTLKQSTQFVYLSESEEVEGESMFITASVPKDRGPKMVSQSIY